MPVFVAPECIARLTALPVERIWCSTWQGLVDGDTGLSVQLGWPGMPWLRLPLGDRPWDKRRAIEGWFAEHGGAQPFIWADDDRRLELSGKPWAGRLSVPSLLIRPRKNIGLTPDHLDAMERWVSASAPRGVADLDDGRPKPPWPRGLRVTDCTYGRVALKASSASVIGKVAHEVPCGARPRR